MTKPAADIRHAKAELWPITKLRPNPKNARKHSPEQIATLRASLREYGWTIPCLVDEAGLILAGHARYEAAIAEGLKQAPVVVARGWSEAKKRAYLIADNKIAQASTWDEALVRVELGELHALGFDIALTGFSLADLQGGTLFADPAAASSAGSKSPPGSLSERFFAVPFSVINAREGWWQDRKRAWLALGIQSELGRGENLIGRSPQEVFCHATGIPYGQARTIVTDAMTAEGKAFDLSALIAKHGGALSSAGDFSGVTMSETIRRLKPSADQALKNARKARAEKVASTKGNGWANGGPARRDAHFYIKKRAWESENGKKISTKEFREKHWGGYQGGPTP